MDSLLNSGFDDPPSRVWHSALCLSFSLFEPNRLFFYLEVRSLGVGVVNLFVHASKVFAGLGWPLFRLRKPLAHALSSDSSWPRSSRHSLFLLRSFFLLLATLCRVVPQLDAFSGWFPCSYVLDHLSKFLRKQLGVGPERSVELGEHQVVLEVHLKSTEPRKRVVGSLLVNHPERGLSRVSVPNSFQAFSPLRRQLVLFNLDS